MSDTPDGSLDPSASGPVEDAGGGARPTGVPPEALEPSGRSEESLPRTAPNPSSRDPESDPDDGSTEIPPVTPDA